MVDRCEHSSGHLHCVQHIHLPPIHIRGTQTCTSVGAHRSTAPIRSVESPRSRSGDAHPTATSSWAYDVISCREAFLFGNKILRMAGIVQMLHALQPPNDNYSYAHPKRTRATQPRNQTRRTATVSPAVPGPCATVLAVSHRKEHHCLLTCSIWLILINLLTAVYYIVSVYNCISITQ